MQKYPLCNCDACPLKDQPHVPPSGPVDAEIAFIGMAPAYGEVKQGEGFSGVSGQLFNAALRAARLDRKQMRIDNAVLCLTPPGQKPPPEALKACRPHVLETVRQVKAFVPIGNEALWSTSTKEDMEVDENGLPINLWRDTDGSIMKVSGILSRRDGKPYMPLVHPAYYLRQDPDGFRDFVDGLRTLVRFKDNPPSERAITWHVPATKEDFFEYMALLREKKLVAVDIEAEEADLIGAKILFVALAWSQNEAMVIPWDSAYLKQWESHYQAFLEDPECFVEFKRTLEQLNTIAYNGIFDATFMLREDIALYLYADPMYQHYSLDERPGTQGLEHVARQFMGLPNWKAITDKYVGKGKKKKSFTLVPVDEFFPYSARDACHEFALNEIQDRMLQGGPRNLYEKLLMRTARNMVKVTHRGVRMSKTNLLKAIEEMPKEIAELEAKLQKLSENPTLNPRSPQQMSRLCYDLWKLPTVREDKPFSVSKEVVDAWREEYPYDEELPDESQSVISVFLHDYQDLGQLNKVFNSYHKESAVLFRDGRGHPPMSVSNTETGRAAGSIALVMPRDSRGEVYRTAKDVYISDEDSFLLSNDYKNHEVRIGAILSQDPWLIDKISDPNFDEHTNTAAAIFPQFKTASGDQKSELRSAAKVLNFRIRYLGRPWANRKGLQASAFNLAKALRAKKIRVSQSEAEALILKFYEPMPKLKEYIDYVITLGKKQGYLEDFIGRRRRFPVITEETVGAVERQMFNFLPQATANEITLLTFNEVVERYFDNIAYPLWPIHDSLLTNMKVRVTREQLKEFLEVFTELPKKTLNTNVPFFVDASVGYSWGRMVKCKSTDPDVILETLASLKRPIA